MTADNVTYQRYAQRTGQASRLHKLLDSEVALLRYFHEVLGWGYRRLAKKFEISKSQVRRICLYQRR